MKKIYFYLLLLILPLTNIMSTFAQEDYNIDNSWDFLINQANTIPVTKPVTNQEFNQALETVKKYQKNDPKSGTKGNKKGRNSQRQSGNSQTTSGNDDEKLMIFLPLLILC